MSEATHRLPFMTKPIARLGFPAYLDHLHTGSARFRAVLAECEPTARVPACPDWDAADLLWHLGEVQHFWGTIVAGRPEGPDRSTAPDRPDDHAGLLRLFDDSSARLADALAGADPAETAWTWAPEQTVGFTYRRQAHEALIHRLDAEQTTGSVTPLDPGLAADGVAELMEVMYGGEPPAWATFAHGDGEVEILIEDLDVAMRVAPGRLAGADPDSGRKVDGPHLVVVPQPDATPAATVRGAAADLDAWLWRRGDDSAITWSGEAAARAAFEAAVSPSID